MLRDNPLIWHCGTHEISLARPRIMGILNVTPDSFSDGGETLSPERAIARGLEMLDQGADIIDVGGESTRPGFVPVTPEEEANRIVPVIRELVAAGAIVSVDTRHAEVARLCVRLGASIINDVTGFSDPAMIKVAATTKAGCIVMHAGEVAQHAPTSRRSVTLDSTAAAREAAAHAAAAGAADAAQASPDAEPAAAPQPEAPETTAAPQSAQLEEVMARASRGIANPTVRLAPSSRRFTLPEEGPIMRQVMGFLGDRARELVRAGVERERICIDPGPGFGKMADEDVVIQRATPKMVSMGYPVVCAISRKRLVGSIAGIDEVQSRDAASAGMAIAAVEAGARILRVHDVEGTVQAIAGYWSIAHPDPRRAFVALGSNLGDRIGYLAQATALIDAIPLTCVVGVSRAYESDPAYGIATPVANAVAEIRTELSPLALLDALLKVEDQLGRVRKPGEEGHGPRTIDCDLAWMEGETHSGKRLTLPHPHLGERDFVLVPMEDLMHDPVRFLAHSGVAVAEPEDRVGRVRKDLGEVPWQA